MSEEERLHIITEQLLIVRDNLFRGMSKSMQKLQARSINEVLELPNFTESPQHTWVDLTDDEEMDIALEQNKSRHWVVCEAIRQFKEKNT